MIVPHDSFVPGPAFAGAAEIADDDVESAGVRLTVSTEASV